MNEVAAVEIETSSPLFFDSYQQNRTTGSFIVIDLLTNATLGAGMISADLSEATEIPVAAETRNIVVPIGALERHRRHGHSAAIILVNARPTFAERLERALFEAGFEVMLVEKKSSLISARTAWATLHAAGFVVLYHNPFVGTDESVDMRAAAGDRFFDLAELDLSAVDAEAVEQVRVLAESLRIPAGAENPGKAV
jgi:hypothetical protein